MARVKRAAAPLGHEDDAEVITASLDEKGALQAVEQLLAETPQGLASDSAEFSEFTIVGPGGRKAPFTASLHRAVLRFARLAQRRPVQISLRSRYLTTTQAAQVLGVSRPYLIKLIEGGELPGEKVGTKRRVAIEDLMAYKQARDARNAGRRAALDRLVEMSGETDVDLAEIEDFYLRIRGGNRNQGGEYQGPQGQGHGGGQRGGQQEHQEQDAPSDVPRNAS